MMSQATFDAALSPGLPVRMALARQAALAWWAAQNRANAWCDQCYRVLAWGEGYLLPAAPSGQQMRKQNSAPADWLVCEQCLCACSTVGAGHDSVCCEESLDE